MAQLISLIRQIESATFHQAGSVPRIRSRDTGLICRRKVLLHESVLLSPTEADGSEEEEQEEALEKAIEALLECGAGTI
jgi:hypothetical protein